jgi:3-hydroxyacyl-CoA dehydrogenase/enoyl-CoA hydratase/3-hydroxybutyryl-CoA epimerase
MAKLAADRRASRPRGTGARRSARAPQAARGKPTVFHVELTDGVALVRMDVPDQLHNTLHKDFAHDLSRLLDDMEHNAEIRSIVFASGKRDSFIVGTDVGMLQRAQSAADVAELARAGQRALSRLECFRKPVVAAVHGACLGGGLELATICRHALASDHEKTRVGLPEVKLGLLPALGATLRLPRRLGLSTALDLLLTGRDVHASQAFALGLIDEVVPEAILLDVACQRARELAANGQRGKPRQPLRRKAPARHKLRELALADNPIARKLVLDRAFDRLLSRTHGNYPAPERILEVVRIGLQEGGERGLEAAAQAFGELVVSPQAAQLMFLFQATTELEKDRGLEQHVDPRAVEKVAVVGAGQMGSGIAWVTSGLAGLPVRLCDTDDAALARALRASCGLLHEQLADRQFLPIEREAMLARITTATDYSGLRDAGVVIEAVFEELDLKQRVAENIERCGGREVIIASCTSSLPISKIAQAVEHPERVVGMHYFSPVHKMPLLEIVVTDQTADWVTATCVELGKRQGKVVIVVRDGVGFFSSRILAPYLHEATRLVSDGVPIDAVDRALVEWGFPVGPILLLDEVGIEVAEKVSRILHDAYGERMSAPSSFAQLLATGRRGKKNGRGFYLYGSYYKRDRRRVDSSVYDLFGVEPRADKPRADLIQRCVLSMVNEAARCFGEGTLRSASDGDVAAVLGLGFPAFRGGPFRYVDTLGALEVIRRLERYEKELGARFSPAPALVEMARRGDRFYGEHQASPGSVRLERGPAPTEHIERVTADSPSR